MAGRIGQIDKEIDLLETRVLHDELDLGIARREAQERIGMLSRKAKAGREKLMALIREREILKEM